MELQRVIITPNPAWSGRFMLTLSRYDWVARPGDYVVENPGTIHTLHMTKDTEVVFTVSGSLEFFHDDDSLKNTMDVFSYAHLYYEHCEREGLTPNDGLWY